MPESNIKLYLLNRKRRVSFTTYHARDGGILDSALTEGLISGGERRCGCIRLKRELGDWVDTNFCVGNREERMKV